MSDRVPHEWAIVTINDFAKLSAGGTPNTSMPEYWENGSIPWMSSGEVNKKRIFAVDKCISELGYKNSSAKLFPKKTILIALAGQGKTRGTVAISEIELSTNQSIAGVLPKSSICFPDFLFHNLTSRYDELRNISTGGGREGLNLSILGNVEVALPPIAEQQKIATILTAVDEVIESTTAQINKLKDLKTGMMQELLTKGNGHTEFKDSPVGRIPKAWEVVELEKLCSWMGVGIATSTTQAYTSQDKGVPILRNQNILAGMIDSSDLLYISSEFSELNNSKKIRARDVITIRTGYPGKSAVVTPEFDGSHTFTTLISRPYPDLLDSDYLALIINSDYGMSFVAGGQAGGAQQNLNVSVLKVFPVKLPSLVEQRQVYELVNSFSQKILLAEFKRHQYEKIKIALMQDLLTGKVRVK